MCETVTDNRNNTYIWFGLWWFILKNHFIFFYFVIKNETLKFLMGDFVMR